MKIGDRVEAVGDFHLVCGSGWYPYAICVSTNPYVLVSPEGDMMWRNTATPGNTRDVGRGTPDEIETAMQRWVRDRLGTIPGLDPEEEQFQMKLDITPNDHTTRLVFADWLQERDDPRALGYRVLGQLQRVPCYDSRYESGMPPEKDNPTWYWVDEEKGHRLMGFHWSRKRMTDDDIKSASIPRVWCEALSGNTGNWNSTSGWYGYYPSRREAEDVAALVFFKLTPTQQEQYLNLVLV